MNQFHAAFPHAVRQQEYSARPPSVPRIILPPTRRASKAPVPLGSESDYTATSFANTSFLHAYQPSDYPVPQSHVDWRYEERRQVQQILPFLYLGPTSAARDRDTIRVKGITMCLAVRSRMFSTAKNYDSTLCTQELGIAYSEIVASTNQELIAALTHGIQSINNHVSVMGPKKGKVLVFCESGNDRSASLVVAYIMAMYGRDLVQAVQIVQAHRFAISLDDGLRLLLDTYATILAARRDVLTSALPRQDSKMTHLEVEQDIDAQDGGRIAAARMQCLVDPTRVGRRGSKRSLDEDGDQLDTGMVDWKGTSGQVVPQKGLSFDASCIMDLDIQNTGTATQGTYYQPSSAYQSTGRIGQAPFVDG